MVRFIAKVGLVCCVSNSISSVISACICQLLEAVALGEPELQANAQCWSMAVGSVTLGSDSKKKRCTAPSPPFWIADGAAMEINIRNTYQKPARKPVSSRWNHAVAMPCFGTHPVVGNRTNLKQRSSVLSRNRLCIALGLGDKTSCTWNHSTARVKQQETLNLVPLMNHGGKGYKLWSFTELYETFNCIIGLTEWTACSQPSKSVDMEMPQDAVHRDCRRCFGCTDLQPWWSCELLLFIWGRWVCANQDT